MSNMKFIPYNNIIQHEHSKEIDHIFISTEEMEHELYSAFSYIGKFIDNGVIIPPEYYKK